MNLLVVVDMVNGFINFGNLADKRINEITPRVVEMIEKAKKSDMKIIAFRDCHSVNDEEFLTYPEHCLRGTAEAELIPELLPYKKDMYIIDKPTTNGFNTREFREIISEHKFDNIVVCGCCTDICVQNFCESLKAFLDKNDISTNIRVYESGVSTFDLEGHNAQEAQAKALRELRDAGIEVVYDRTLEDEKNN